ncbi:hypothetical protein RB623_22995 [Mesorhizobium sp. LHD-90]|uniref:hypothetical protein n=1 Tax=Mesorhizobium sp. LHD-90 TaxID=3071414 RepID=UPI0027DF12D9|nr:hypothetical protein [Mesorhizobium sp. LHD-90]MDQ6436928.1 hypothetical protein [Mesorhizobium sp. LHD-90]
MAAILFLVVVTFIAAIAVLIHGLTSKSLSLGWRIVVLAIATALSVPGFYALYILMAFSSLHGGSL